MFTIFVNQANNHQRKNNKTFSFKNDGSPFGRSKLFHNWSFERSVQLVICWKSHCSLCFRRFWTLFCCSFKKKLLANFLTNLQKKGFFLTVCPEAIRKVAKYSHENARVFCMNLSAPFVSQYFGDNFKEIFPYVRILFGNNDVRAWFLAISWTVFVVVILVCILKEAESFSEYILGVKVRFFGSSIEINTLIVYMRVYIWKTNDTVEIAKNISKMPALNGNQHRIVIITQGSDPIIVAIGKQINLHIYIQLPCNYIQIFWMHGKFFQKKFWNKIIELFFVWAFQKNSSLLLPLVSEWGKNYFVIYYVLSIKTDKNVWVKFYIKETQSSKQQNLSI